jgi:2-iminobutanoate/2-iminopropanoate deaminase
MLEIEHLMSNQGPKPVGPFSHAVRAGDFLFVTGQMPTLPDDPETLVSGGIQEQTKQVFQNLNRVLEGLDSTLEQTVFCRVYLVNFQDFDLMNEVYSSYFSKHHLPGRTCIGVTGLAVGSLVEIDLIAAC